MPTETSIRIFYTLIYLVRQVLTINENVDNLKNRNIITFIVSNKKTFMSLEGITKLNKSIINKLNSLLDRPKKNLMHIYNNYSFTKHTYFVLTNNDKTNFL